MDKMTDKDFKWMTQKVKKCLYMYIYKYGQSILVMKHCAKLSNSKKHKTNKKLKSEREYL
jgi:replication initiation and membrane attachment protein DnaB